MYIIHCLKYKSIEKLPIKTKKKNTKNDYLNYRTEFKCEDNLSLTIYLRKCVLIEIIYFGIIFSNFGS